jgi:hypothetical protein
MAKEKKAKEKAKPKPKEKKEKASSGGMQQMLMDHGEKIGLGVVGVIFLACVVFGFVGKTQLADNKTVESLGTAIDGVKRKMEEIKYTPEKDPNWVGLAEKSSEKVPPAVLALKPWVPVLFPLEGVRVEPRYFPAEQIRVIAGRAPFNVGAPATDANGLPAAGSGEEPPEGSSSKGEHYVVGTFLIPVGAQRAEYVNAFEGSMKMPGDERLAQDLPEYYRYMLERQKVTPGAPMDDATWVVLGQGDNAGVTDDNRQPLLEAKKAEWAEPRDEIIPGPFLNQALTYGRALAEEEVGWLPPRLPKDTSTDWTWNEVGHGVIADLVRKFQDQAAAPAAALKPDDPAANVDPAEQMEKFAETQPYKMGRFWDFAVEPGASYRYRITLVLRNPNRGYTKQYLKDEKLAVGDFRPVSPLDANDMTRPVSAPSYPVQIPGSVDLAVGGIIPEGENNNRTGEDLGTIAATVWENTAEAIADYEKEANAIRVRIKKEQALAALATLQEVWATVDYVEASKEFRVARGQYLSMKGPTQIVHPMFGKVETLRNVRFDTGYTLVDIHGGKAPAKAAGFASAAAPTMDPPIQYLLLDPDGNLIVRSEISDRVAFQRKTAAAAQAPVDDAAGNTIDQLNR